MPLPPPGCACGHVYGFHPGGGQCRFQPDRDDPESRCRCGKFTVPSGPGKPKKRPAARSGARGSNKPPWWR